MVTNMSYVAYDDVVLRWCYHFISFGVHFMQEADFGGTMRGREGSEKEAAARRGGTAGREDDFEGQGEPTVL